MEIIRDGLGHLSEPFERGFKDQTGSLDGFEESSHLEFL